MTYNELLSQLLELLVLVSIVGILNKAILSWCQMIDKQQNRLWYILLLYVSIAKIMYISSNFHRRFHRTFTH